MLVTFNEIKTEVLTFLNLQSSDDESIIDSIELRINQIQDKIVFSKNWEWRKRTYYFTARTPYTTGTISVTQNSKTVTGSSTSWDETVRSGYLVIGSKAYKINRYASATSLILEAAYPDATASAQTYKIVFPNYVLNHNISSVIAVRVAGRDIDVVDKDRLSLDVAATGEPTRCAIGDRTNEDWYNTGTVTGTNGAATITGSGTTFTSEMEGMSLRINEFSKMYTIKSVDSVTQITLTENYEGTTGAGKGYKINPSGMMQISFRNSPDDYYYVEVDVLIEAPKLVGNNDISIIPNHEALLSGAIWKAGKDLKSSKDVEALVIAFREFQESMKQLTDSYKAITQVKWQSPREIAYKKSIGNKFDPLDWLS